MPSPFHQARLVPNRKRKTVYDTWNGYQSVPVPDKNGHLTTFNTPWGRYRYKTAPKDTETKTISLALYRYMCQNIVGSENHVKTMRLINTVRDNFTSGNECIITSGSFGEGLEMRGSDLDLIYVNRDMKVYEKNYTTYNSDEALLTMETDDVKAGFTQLQVKPTDPLFLSFLCEERNGKHYFSSAIFKKVLLHNSSGVVHGPCVSNKTGTQFSYSTKRKTMYNLVEETFTDIDTHHVNCRVCLGLVNELPLDIAFRNHTFDSAGRKRLNGRKREATISTDRNALCKGGTWNSLGKS
ncbi:unnamed protein product [Mytilus edulis]|uniref:Uncharacterized protein n=1 Tax=Mytilus edulis TaxID=6550 RepID=A0A8S3S0Q4_MYTED|nr:unnamed protein product [Mytilus edulis]